MHTDSIFKGICSVLLALILVGLSGCSRFLYFPSHEWVRTPAQLGINFEEVVVVSADGTRLSAWWLDAVGEPKGTVVFFHGNAENISTHIGSVYWLPEAGYQVLMMDYRGYGYSEGKPGIPGIFADISATLEWAYTDPRTHDKPVYMLGQSLGATMSGYVIATEPELREGVTGVVLDAAFASYAEITRDVASRHWLTWAFQYPAAWTMPRNYDLIDYIDQVSPTPLLIIHSSTDNVIPYSNGEALFSVAGKPKNFMTYEGPHIGTFIDLELRQMMLGFFADARARQKVRAVQQAMSTEDE